MKFTTTSLHKQQQGMGHILVVILVLVVVGVIGFVGYTVANKNKSTKASSTTTATTAKSEAAATDTSCVATYHDANLCKFASHASLDKVAYKAAITGTDTSGTTSNLTLESDGKGNTSMTGTSNGQQFSAITLDGSSYLLTNGVWYKSPASASATSTAPDPTANMNLVLGAGITYKPLGKVACGSLTCFEYSVTDSAVAGSATQYAWFDDQSYLLREWKYTDTTSGTTDMTLTYPSVTITAPSPVQDLSTLGQ